MSLPASKRALIRLGERMAAGDLIDGDVRLFEDTMIAFDDVRQRLFRTLVEAQLLGDPAAVTITSRTKTRGTLIEKLQMRPTLGLPNMQDIAGVRIVLSSGGLVEQDEIAKQIRTLGILASTKLADRRATPMQGYRALHLIGIIDGVTVEIQIRTELQDAWANLFERIGDMWGRKYRYEQPPDDIPKFTGPGQPTRAQIVSLTQNLSTQFIASYENEQVERLKRTAQRRLVFERYKQLEPMSHKDRASRSEQLRTIIRTHAEISRLTQKLRGSAIDLISTLGKVLDTDETTRRGREQDSNTTTQF